MGTGEVVSGVALSRICRHCGQIIEAPRQRVYCCTACCDAASVSRWRARNRELARARSRRDTAAHRARRKEAGG